MTSASANLTHSGDRARGGAVDRPSSSRPLRTALAASILIAAGIAAYANGFTGHFAGLDARESIRDNPHIRTLWPLSEAMSLSLLTSTKAADEGSKGGTVVRRPILSLSFALNYQLTGSSPNGFHAVNIAIHLLNGLLLFGIVRRSLSRPQFAERFGAAADGLALATALLWTLHPLQTESVTYIVQRAESLMGLFFLLAVYAAVRAFDSPAPTRWYALAVAACALGMATKEVAAVAPVIVLLYDATFVSSGAPAAVRARPRFYAALFSTWAVVVGLMLMTLEDVGSDFTEGRNLSYALAQPAVILHYLRVAAWPHPLHVYINTTLYDGLSPLRVAGPLFAIVALLGATAWGVVQRRWYGFVGAWFFLILAPSSSVVAVSDIIQEHRIYLSLAALVFLAVLGAYLALQRVGGGRFARAGIALAAAAALVFAVLTHRRNRDYHSEFAMIHPADLYEAYLILGNHYTLGDGDPLVAGSEADEALRSNAPGSPDFTFAHYLLGLLADARGDNRSAATHFAQASESDPAFVRAAAKLGEMLLALDDPAGARQVLERAAQHTPASTDLQLALGRALLAMEDVEGARRSFESVVALAPDFAAGHNNLGFVLERLGDLPRAQAEYQAALTLDPGMVVARRNLARVLALNGDLAGARRDYEAVLAIEPTEAPAQVGLAEVCEQQEDVACAEAHLREAARLEPEDAQIASSLGALVEKLGRTDEAQREYERALALEPEHVGARNALGTLLARKGRFQEAQPHFEHVLRSDPNNADAHSNLGALYAAQGEKTKAADHLQAVLRLQPTRRAANFNLGLLFEEQGDFDRAEKHYERELEIDPTFEPARANLARVRARLGR